MKSFNKILFAFFLISCLLHANLVFAQNKSNEKLREINHRFTQIDAD